MAAQGKVFRTKGIQAGSILYWLAAGLAGVLSLAAALLAVLGPRPDANAIARRSPGEESAARAERIAFFEARAEGDPFDTVALNVLTSEYLIRARETGDIGDYKRALNAADRSVDILPLYYSSLLAAANAHNAVHDFAGGLAFAIRAIEARPAQGAGYALRGDPLLALGRYDEAGFDYQKSLALDPGFGAFSRLANLAFLEGDGRNAEDFWSQAVSVSRTQSVENEAWARVQLGLLHFERGELKKAEAEAGRALKVYPNYPHALALKARIAAARADYGAAIADYEAVVARQPLIDYVAALGDTYLAAGLADAAESQFALVEAIDRLYRANGVNTDLSLSLYYAGHDRNLDRALALARNAYDAAPGVYAADALAWALLKNEQPREASRYSDEAMRLGTPDVSLLYHAGMVQKALGNDPRALDLLERAMSTNPYFSTLQVPVATAAIAQLRAAARAGR